MGAQDGVLAAMDRALLLVNDDLDHDGELFDTDKAADVFTELTNARAAIAGLIAAAKRANGDHTAPHDCYATGPLTGDPHHDLVACPGCELASALAALEGK